MAATDNPPLQHKNSYNSANFTEIEEQKLVVVFAENVVIIIPEVAQLNDS